MSREHQGDSLFVPDQLDSRGLLLGNGPVDRILLFSAKDRDGLSRRLGAMGWPVIGVRMKDGLVPRFKASGAMVAIMDLRDEEKALDAVFELGAYVEELGLAMLALVNDGDDSTLAAIRGRGVTHFQSMPASDAALQLAVELAVNSARRTVGKIGPLLHDRQRDWQQEYSWQLGDDHAPVWGAALCAWFGQHRLSVYPRTALYRSLSVAERKDAHFALSRLSRGQTHAAFRHDLDGRNIVHHLHQEGKVLFGHIEHEWLHDWVSLDPVTGLANDLQARVWLDNAITNQRGSCVLMLGLVNFELINNSYGRETGDRLLAGIGRRLKKIAKAQGIEQTLVARTSGREFCIAFPFSMEMQRLNLIAQDVLEEIERPFYENGRDIVLSGRIGLAGHEPGEPASQFLRRARLVLGDALASDASAIRMSGEEGGDDAQFDEMIDRDLRHALAIGQIEVLFQPQFDVVTGHLTGCEALARWQHDRLGLLGAETLFKVAERSGFLLPLSSHIQRIALQVAARWPAALEPLRLSINVTPQDLSAHNFIQRLFRMVEESGFPPERLTLEITEGALMGNVKLVARRLERIREYGIAVAIDDFGTGYSSLAYLKQLPLDYLKMDKDLTQDIAGEERDRIVVLAVLSLAQSLGLKTIAEGVEDTMQLDLLAREGCDFFQGFLRSPALLPDAFERFALRAN